MNRFFLFILALLLWAPLSSCQKLDADIKTEAETPVFEVIDVGPVEAEAVIDNEDVIVLDVRTPEEYSAGRIEGAVNYNVKADGFEEAIKSLDFSKPVLVHCAAGLPGGRSRFALDFLRVAGAGKVYHLDGGMMAWQEAGKEVEKPGAAEVQ